MINSLVGFVELGLIVLAWLYIFSFILKPFLARRGDHPAAQGASAVLFA